MAYTAQPVGILADLVTRIREYADEPVDNPKWPTDRLYVLMRESWAKCVRDLNAAGEARLIGYFDLPLIAGTARYQIPSNVGRVLRIGQRDASTGYFTETMIPRSLRNPLGPAYVFEGRSIRFETVPVVSETVTLEYIPNGECWCHLGTCTAANTSSTTLKLNSAPSEGYYDGRQSAYLGYLLRILSASGAPPYSLGGESYTVFPPQERLITGQVTATGVITVSPAFDGDLSGLTGQSFTYEVVPAYHEWITHMVALDVARMLHKIENRHERAIELAELFLEERRSTRLELQNLHGQIAGKWAMDVPGGGRYGPLW